MAGWPPQKIRAELILRGVKQKDIAARAGVSSGMVCLVINSGKVSRRVRAAIAKAAGARVGDIWPAR